MKTPEETKKGLALCVNANPCNYPCEECPYVEEDDGCKSMMEDALAYIQQLEAQVPKWISVEDEQKPIHGHYYLCVCTLPNDPEHKFDWISVRWWNATAGNDYVDRPHFSDEGVEGMTVTHWMPLPEPPEEE